MGLENKRIKCNITSIFFNIPLKYSSLYLNIGDALSESETSTIVLSKKLKHELADFKQYDRETYEDVIGRILHIAQEADESKLELSEETKKGIARGKEDFKKGRTYTTDELKKKLGL